jgi:hypothetical protein
MVCKIKFILLGIIIALTFSDNAKCQIIDSMFVFKTDDEQKSIEKFYNTAWGFDIMASDNGFGLGWFYKKNYSDRLSASIDLSISEGKDERELEYVDYWGNVYTPNKVTRVIMLPLMLSVEYRIFRNDIIDSFRPYITAGAGPIFLFTSPASRDFFEAIKYYHARYTAGGYIGIGCDFGADKKTLTGVSIQYHYTPYPNGIEVMQNTLKKSFSGLYITLYFGMMN